MMRRLTSCRRIYRDHLRDNMKQFAASCPHVLTALPSDRSTLRSHVGISAQGTRNTWPDTRGPAAGLWPRPDKPATRTTVLSYGAAAASAAPLIETTFRRVRDDLFGEQALLSAARRAYPAGYETGGSRYSPEMASSRGALVKLIVDLTRGGIANLTTRSPTRPFGEYSQAPLLT